MTRPERWNWLKDAFRGDQRRATIALLFSPLLVVVWRHYGSIEFYLNTFASNPDSVEQGAAAGIYTFLSCFVLLGVIPALVVRKVFHERLADYGLQYGDPVLTPRAIAIWGPFFLFAAYIGAQNPAVRAAYPINPQAGASLSWFVLHSLFNFVHYIAWEFHFRGFLQFSLRRAMGETNAVLVVVLATCLIHIGKPACEVFGTMPSGLLWCLLAFRTRSILSGLFQHALLGIALDWFICFG